MSLSVKGLKFIRWSHHRTGIAFPPGIPNFRPDAVPRSSMLTQVLPSFHGGREGRTYMVRAAWG